jgi:hypothetical protein
MTMKIFNQDGVFLARFLPAVSRSQVIHFAAVSTTCSVAVAQSLGATTVCSTGLFSFRVKC